MRVAIFDLDGTLVPGQTQKAFVRFLRTEGVMSFRHYLSLMAWFIAYKLGITRDVEAVQARAFGMLAGREAGEFDRLVDRFFETQVRPRFFPSGIELVQRHLAQGAHLLLVSNAIEPIARRAADFLGIREVVATCLESRDGRFTGRIAGGNVYGENKLVRVRERLAESGWTDAETWAYCDHPSDLPLLQAVNHPVVVNPGRAMAREARSHGFPVSILSP
jgi:HAD superfamily hydrolase (TIGR01490 family)